jgi:hypothetical protein
MLTMKLFAAILVLGQVGTPGEIGAPPATNGIPANVRLDDTAEIPQPMRPTVPGPARPSEVAPVETQPQQSVPGVLRERPTGEFPPSAPSSAPSAATLLPAEPVAERFPSASPATSTPTAASAPDIQAWQIASSMLEQILMMDDQPATPLRRVRLIETLSRQGDPSLSSVAIREYWDLVQAIAAARYSADKVRLLTDVARPATEGDQALLAESLATAEAEEAAANDRLLASQYELLRVTGLSLDGGLPWPADVPHVAPYRTQFTTIFANRQAPLGVQQIHHRLPGKLTLIEKRLAAMSAAENAVDALSVAYQSGRAQLVPVIGSIERLDRSRREFLASVVDYNQQIADYALSVVGPNVGPETLVATLIKVTPASGPLVNVAPEIRQAAASEPTPGELRYR